MPEEDEVERRARAIVEARSAEATRREQRLEARESEYQKLIDNILSTGATRTRAPFYFDGDTDFIAYCSSGGTLRRVTLVTVLKGHGEDDEEFIEEDVDGTAFEYSVKTFVDEDSDDPLAEEWGEPPDKILEIAVEGVVAGLAYLVADGHQILAHEEKQPATAKPSEPIAAADAVPSGDSGGCVGVLFLLGVGGLAYFVWNLIN